MTDRRATTPPGPLPGTSVPPVTGAMPPPLGSVPPESIPVGAGPATAGTGTGTGPAFDGPPPPGAAGPQAAGLGAEAPDIGWMGDLHGATRSLRGMLQGRLMLLSLELRRAKHGLASLMVLLVVAAIAGATAWFALWAGLAALAVQLGLSWPWACAAVVLCNGLLLLWVAAAMKTLAPMLSLPASRRQLHWLFNDPTDPEDTPANGIPTTTP